MQLPLEFISIKDSKYYDILLKRGHSQHPVALILGDIEIHFFHYSSVDDALQKWNRRKMRMNNDKLLIKFSEGVNSRPDLVRRFIQLPFKNKICFSSNQYESTVVIKLPGEVHKTWKKEWIFTKKLVKNLLNDMTKQS